MLYLVGAVAFDTFKTLNSTCKSGVSSLPAIFTLGDTKVYVCSMDSSNVASYIEASID